MNQRTAILPTEPRFLETWLRRAYERLDVLSGFRFLPDYPSSGGERLAKLDVSIGGVAHIDAIVFGWVQIAPNKTRVRGECREDYDAAFDALWLDMLQEFGASGGYGTQGGTLERVREARALIEDGAPKTKACKRARIDPRTYDRYVTEIVDWEHPLTDS